MGNPVRGEASFTKGDRTYTIRLRTNELAELEDTLGKGVMALAEGQELSFRFVRACVYVGLKHSMNRSELRLWTVEAAGRLLDEDDIDLPEVVGAISRAFASGFPGASVTMEDDEPSPKATGGANPTSPATDESGGTDSSPTP